MQLKLSFQKLNKQATNEIEQKYPELELLHHFYHAWLVTHLRKLVECTQKTANKQRRRWLEFVFLSIKNRRIKANFWK